MTTLFDSLLSLKRAALEQARIHHEELQQEVAALERTAKMPLPPELLAEAPALRKPRLTKKEKHALRHEQIMEMFHRHGGVLRLTTIMNELKVSRNGAKDWMNAGIDQSPEMTPWTRVDGNRSRFMLKDSSAGISQKSERPKTLGNESEIWSKNAIGLTPTFPLPEAI